MCVTARATDICGHIFIAINAYEFRVFRRLIIRGKNFKKINIKIHHHKGCIGIST